MYGGIHVCQFNKESCRQCTEESMFASYTRNPVDNVRLMEVYGR